MEKQDSETAAAKRWIAAHHNLVGSGCFTLLGDDLYSRQPMGQTFITKGYYLEHDFGYGHRHLAMTLSTLNVLAFLFHTVLHLVHGVYQ